MSNRDVLRIARELAGLKRAAEGAKVRQLPSSSVLLEDGTEKAIADGLGAGVDALDLYGSTADAVADVTDVATDAVLDQSLLPDHLAAIGAGTDAAFDVAVNATEKVVEALTQAENAIRAAAESSEFASGALEVAEAAKTASDAASNAAEAAKQDAADAAQAAIDRAAEAEATAKEFASTEAAAMAGDARAAAILAAKADAKIQADAAEAAAKAKAREAQEAADAAGVAAQSAATKADQAREDALRNARYRIGPDEVYVPAKPVDGFRLGAQLVRMDELGRPFQIDRWSGTAWVRDQILADQMLVAGENGTVWIENGRIVAPELVGGEITGSIVRGAQIFGGELTLPAAVGGSAIYSGPTSAETSTYTAGTSTWVTPGRDGTGGCIRWTPLTWSGTYFGYLGFAHNTTESFDRVLEVWFKAPVETVVALKHTGGTITYGSAIVYADQWCLLSADIPAGSSLSPIITVETSVPRATVGQLWIDDVVLKRTTSETRYASIRRNARGTPEFLAYGRNGESWTTQDEESFTLTGNRGTAKLGYDPVGRPFLLLANSGKSAQISVDASTGVMVDTFPPKIGDPLVPVKINAPTRLDGGIRSNRYLKILWSGAVYMQGGQTINLSELVSDQLSGIMLCWSSYGNGAAINTNFFYQFIPKAHIALHPGAGVEMYVNRGGALIRKYVYVNDSSIAGNAANADAPNGGMVLREVIGV